MNMNKKNKSDRKSKKITETTRGRSKKKHLGQKSKSKENRSKGRQNVNGSMAEMENGSENNRRTGCLHLAIPSLCSLYVLSMPSYFRACLSLIFYWLPMSVLSAASLHVLSSFACFPFFLFLVSFLPSVLGDIQSFPLARALGTSARQYRQRKRDTHTHNIHTTPKKEKRKGRRQRDSEWQLKPKQKDINSTGVSEEIAPKPEGEKKLEAAKEQKAKERKSNR